MTAETKEAPPGDDPPETKEPAPITFKDAPVHISTEDARNSGAYRRAKALAAEQGQPLVIDPPIPVTVEPAAGTLFIPKNATPQQYRAMKADAERRGVPYAISQEK